MEERTMRNTPEDVAEFIRTLTVELTDLARSADLQALGVILTLASLEAKRAGQTRRRAQSARQSVASKTRRRTAVDAPEFERAQASRMAAR
jgi:hypothetical protein